jgi:hypothetical protein
VLAGVGHDASTSEAGDGDDDSSDDSGGDEATPVETPALLAPPAEKDKHEKGKGKEKGR